MRRVPSSADARRGLMTTMSTPTMVSAAMRFMPGRVVLLTSAAEARQREDTRDVLHLEEAAERRGQLGHARRRQHRLREPPELPLEVVARARVVRGSARRADPLLEDPAV